MKSYDKICNYCNKEFIAQTRVTQFCGNNCAKRGYKLKKRLEADDYFNDQEVMKRLLLKINITLEHIEDVLGKLPKNIIKDVKREYLTVEEFCSILNIHERTLRRWMKSNLIEFIKQGKNILIKSSELENCKQSITKKPNTRAHVKGINNKL